jgi:hypothetical protein
VRATALISVLPIALLVAACSRSDRPQSTALSDDLKRDLAAASATGVELASSSHGYQPTRFVSAIEQPRGAAPAPKAVARRHVPRHTASPKVEEQPAVAPAPEPEVVAPQEVAAAPQETKIEAPAPAPEPTVIAPRPAPVPASYPAGESQGTHGRAGNGGGDVLGGIIGVIIRGGNGGIDHCDPRTDGRRGRGGVYGGTMGRYPIGISGVIPSGLPTRGGIFRR